MAKRINPTQADKADKAVKVTKPAQAKPSAKKQQAKPADKAPAKAATIKPAVPVVMRDSQGHTFILVGQRKLDNVGIFMSSRAGYVTLEYGDSIGEELKPMKYNKPFVEAVKPYTKAGGNTLDVSSAAQAVLDAIAANDDPTRNDFANAIKPNLLAATAKPTSKGNSKPSGKTAAREGFVQLKTLLEEFKLDGKKVRQWLRAHYTKPEAGWQWTKDEAVGIRNKLAQHFKVDKQAKA